MLRLTSFQRLVSNVLQQQQRRGFLLTTAAAALGGTYIFGRDARLADAMDRGELHNKNEEFAALKAERTEKRIQALSHNRPMEPRYEGHVPLYLHEKVLLFAISGIRAFFHPENGINIVQLGEATAFPFFLESLKQTMLADETGRRILRDQPNVRTDILDMDKLSKLPKNTFGYTFYKWLEKENVSPDTRAPVTYIDDPIHAFVFKRYRQCHDFYHALNDLPVIIEGEIAVKALESANMGIPMATLGWMLAPLRLKKPQRERLYNTYLPWAIKTGLSCKPLINVYWEELLEKDAEELRQELGIKMPPDLRAMRAKRKAMIKRINEKYDSAKR